MGSLHQSNLDSPPDGAPGYQSPDNSYQPPRYQAPLPAANPVVRTSAILPMTTPQLNSLIHGYETMSMKPSRVLEMGSLGNPTVPGLETPNHQRAEARHSQVSRGSGSTLASNSTADLSLSLCGPSSEEVQLLYSENAGLKAQLIQFEDNVDAVLDELETAQASLEQERQLSNQKDAEIAKLRLEKPSTTTRSKASDPRISTKDFRQMQTQLRDMQAELDHTKKTAREAASKAQRVVSRAAREFRELQARENELKAILQTAVGRDKVDENDRQEEIDDLTEMMDFYKGNSQRLSAEAEASRIVQDKHQQSDLEKDRRIRELEMQISAMERIG